MNVPLWDVGIKARIKTRIRRSVIVARITHTGARTFDNFAGTGILISSSRVIGNRITLFVNTSHAFGSAGA
ncbi:hypothetical protein MMG03_002741 [Fibrobacter succinogenes]|nr:hypothetical protein [Fibrobacter succinogenes]